MSDDKIIQGHFGPQRTTEPGPYAKPTAGNPAPGDPRQPSPPTLRGHKGPESFGAGMLVNPEAVLSEAQHKAIGLILAGKPFVFIALSPTNTGCDFYRAVHGEKTDLQNAAPHLHAQLDKALTGAGVTL